jgi:hypothetical protein
MLVLLRDEIMYVFVSGLWLFVNAHAPTLTLFTYVVCLSPVSRPTGKRSPKRLPSGRGRCNPRERQRGQEVILFGPYVRLIECVEPVFFCSMQIVRELAPIKLCDSSRKYTSLDLPDWLKQTKQ